MGTYIDVYGVEWCDNCGFVVDDCVCVCVDCGNSAMECVCDDEPDYVEYYYYEETFTYTFYYEEW